GREQSVVIVGDAGTIEVTRPFLPEWEPATVILRREGHAVHEQRFDVPGANQFLHQSEHFASLVLDPSRDAWPAEDGARNVAACEALEKSWRSGAPVSIEVV
ncbi:MAG TPA: hypothetical protein VMI75_26635, partial [Polyangiaceae bacterium]|nr:hypothetical protein [Polyangiaceae bacterium]